MENTTITLTQEDFTPEALLLADYGYFLDLFALSAKQWTFNDLDENNWDYYAESMQYPLDQFNFEDAYIDALNAGTEKPPVAIAKKTKLLAGAYVALEYPEEFGCALQDYERKLREQATDCIGNYETDNPELNTELTEAYESMQKEQYREWLHGDYRENYAGILAEAAKCHDFENVEYSDSPGTLTIEVSPEWVIDYVTGEEDLKANSEEIKSDIIAIIVHQAKLWTEEESRKLKTRQEEYQKTRDYQKKRAEDDKQARIEKLKAMTR